MLLGFLGLLNQVNQVWKSWIYNMAERMIDVVEDWTARRVVVENWTAVVVVCRTNNVCWLIVVGCCDSTQRGDSHQSNEK